MAKTAEDRIATAQASFEAGFASKAAQKRALDELSSAYEGIRRYLMDAILKARTEENDAQNEQDYWAIPMYLHEVRDRHFPIAYAYTGRFAIVRDLMGLRAAIKDAPIAPPPAKPEVEVKAEAIRRSIVEEMERRKANFVEGLDVARIWNEVFPSKNGGISLPVSVNAHWVHGHKGTDFVRHFFYLSGKLTPLNTIIAIADTLQREKDAAGN